MIIGVDFDNTIVRFDPLFHEAALEKKLIPPTVPLSKESVRDFLRNAGREPEWTALQGEVYGRWIDRAEAFPGVREFFARCVRDGVRVMIISHKTLKPFLGHPYDLHAAALRWLESRDFFGGVGLKREAVFLELTKEAKIARIAREACTHFIDDLPEFLSEPSFPQSVEKILFDPRRARANEPGLRSADSWRTIESWLLSSTR